MDLIAQEENTSSLENVDNNRYRGNSKGGIRHGNGTYSYPMGGREMFKYNGNWVTGNKKGKGKFSIAGVSDYEGEFDSNGEITGYGKRTWVDGRIY